jgi:hypothetical protein
VREPGFAVWVTGPEPESVRGVADSVARQLGARGCAVEVLDAHTPGLEEVPATGRDAALLLGAALLVRHGAVAILGLAGTRAGRDRARAELGRFLEVWVRPAAGAPGASYEPPDRAEVEILVPEPAPGAGVERTIRTLEVLQLLPRSEPGGYSEEEEREVIRRLKAFGYI